MSENNNESKQERRENRFAEAVAEIAHSQLGYFIGIGFMMFAIYIGTKWDGHLFDRKGCIEIKETSTAIYKVDTCTGDTEKLELKVENKINPTSIKTEKNASNK